MLSRIMTEEEAYGGCDREYVVHLSNVLSL